MGRRCQERPEDDETHKMDRTSPRSPQMERNCWEGQDSTRVAAPSKKKNECVSSVAKRRIKQKKNCWITDKHRCEKFLWRKLESESRRLADRWLINKAPNITRVAADWTNLLHWRLLERQWKCATQSAANSYSLHSTSCLTQRITCSCRETSHDSLVFHPVA